MANLELEMQKNKDFDHINYRIYFINNLLKNLEIEHLTDYNFSNIETYIENLIKYNKDEDESNDLRKYIEKKSLDFNTIIKKIGGKLLYIKSGSTGHTFKGMIPELESSPDNFNYAVKIVAYPKKDYYGEIFSPSRPENTELLMLKLLSYFVIKKQTPHIILPVCTFNTSIKPFLSLPKNNIVNNKKFEQFVKRYKKKEYYEQVSVLISEWANNGDLLDYIRSHAEKFTIKQWRVLFFQLISVLAIIQAKFPSFRHNDLKANNILMHHITNSKEIGCYFRYKINGQEYIVPNMGFQIKLWDFDFACIPGVVNNNKVDAEWTDKINVCPRKNQYYDLHYFFNTLTKKGFFPEFFTSKSIPNKVKQFVRRIVPEKYVTGDEVTERGRILIDDEYITPDQVLKTDEFFEKMRKKY